MKKIKETLDSLIGEDSPTLEEPTSSFPSIPQTPVPNSFPTISNVPYRLAIVGEAPGEHEARMGKPFVGPSGRFLNQLLSRAGIVREACFVGNVCQLRPPANNIVVFKRDGVEIRSGMAQLDSDLKDFQPNLMLLLGKTALWSEHGDDKIGNWRGSLFMGRSNRKCLASYHPAACLRQYEFTYPLLLDLFKARREAETPTLILPQRNLVIDLTAYEIVQRLEAIKSQRPLISIDIEGGINSMSCLSVATSPTESFIVPFARGVNGNFYQTVEDEFSVWRALVAVLSDPAIPKVLQNSLYDRFVLQYSYGVVVRGTVDDTMLKAWEKHCELEKGLGFQASIYTNEPYYKSDRGADNRDVFFRYCCRDSAVTYEINDKIKLDEAGLKHYRFNVGLLNPLLYMELRGIKYDTKLAKERLKEVDHHIYTLQNSLDAIAGCGVRPPVDRQATLSLLRSSMCYKNNPTQPKKDYREAYDWCARVLVGEGQLEPHELGRLSVEMGLSMNIKSPKFKTFLYDRLGLPIQWKVDPKTKLKHPATDYEALLKLSKKQPHPAVDLALQIGSLRTRSQMLSISSDHDNRIRCGYNIVGTETGRITCYTSPTGSGYNLQTIPAEDSLRPVGHPLRNGMRDLFVADEQHYLFQCDLSGADGWTVAAHLASLGDSTMLEDYRAGIKPAKVLCFLLRHGAASLSGKTRQEIKDLTKEVSKDSWDYFACKIGQHGTCYLMGEHKLANQIFIQSEGKVNFSSKEAGDLQKLFFVRYRVALWHNWMRRHLKLNHNKLTSASGHTRKFLAREDEVLGEALAHEPQANTTYATNLAAWRLWTDPENRTGAPGRILQRCSLRIEPLHQVHDALLGQFKIEDTPWAVSRIKQYFANEIVIAGIPITIPFEGSYGTNWALDDKSRVGSI